MNFLSASSYAIISGGCGAAGSFFGKLSGLSTLQGPLLILRIISFILMIICNGGVWTFYVKALQASSSSLSATILSAGSNYFLSSLIGFFVFGEIATLLWWSGMVFVLLGVILISSDQPKVLLVEETEKNS